MWFRIIFQQLINQILATHRAIAFVNLNLNLAIRKYLNLVVPTGYVCLDHNRIVAHSG